MIGKYAAYVLPAMGATVVVFAWMIADSLASARKWRREFERLSGK